MKKLIPIFSCLLIITLHTAAQQFTKDVKEYISIDTPVIALLHVKIIDGTGSSAKLDQTIIINKGIIEKVGDAAAVGIPKNCYAIDCTGKTIIPGMVMMHEHFFYTVAVPGFFNVAEMPYSFPRMYLASGATTIRTTGSIEPSTDLNIKRMIGKGEYIGPDIDVTGPYFEQEGWEIPSLNIIKDEKDAIQTVDFWADRGVTSFKMYMTLKKSVMQAAITEAHKRNIKVTGHICAVTYREAAEIGIDNLEHGFLVSTDFDKNKKPDECDDEGGENALKALPVNSPEMKSLMDFLISKHVAITSTLPVFEPSTGREVILGGGDSALVPEMLQTVTKRWTRRQNKDSSDIDLFKKEMVWEKQFYDAGGLLLAGTDPTGSGRTLAGYGTRRQVELLVEAGFTVPQAIKICSLNGAVYLGRDKQIGTVEAGKYADLVLIDGDIEKDIKAIRNTEIVFKKGVGFNSKKIFDSVKGKVGLY
ncbi:amidohydrolase family protein [Ferruginibacter albus]|uniref:amidohydrolase family protein n=1 Tax=Ferruginibacter albus TaxID=2875540 RepID=UPI001CC57746|nr:amidohydrolase family protein [Ferruginibacter albus]UAY50977.1 amidohydrolase family protein [Ferruginibacter albus]